MKIEIWSDVICPWCGLGQHRLDRALTELGRDDVEVVHRSFQLDPRAPERVRPVREMLAEKYGANDAQLRASQARIEAMAAADGLTPYHVADNVVGNTHLAHELLAMASERGLEDAAWKRIYKAYFAEQRSIFTLDDLVGLGAELGLDRDEVRSALTEGRYREKVDRDAREAQALGATGVPFVVIDRKYGIAGAQPLEVFRKVLEKASADH